MLEARQIAIEICRSVTPNLLSEEVYSDILGRNTVRIGILTKKQSDDLVAAIAKALFEQDGGSQIPSNGNPARCPETTL